MRNFSLSWFAVAAFSLSATSAFAHASIVRTTIANGASASTSPASYGVTFSSPVRLATVSLANSAGQPVALNFRPPTASLAAFSIPLPNLPAGTYTMSFRTMSNDGHVMTPQTTFTIGAATQTVTSPSMPGMTHGRHDMSVKTSLIAGTTPGGAPRGIRIQFPHPMTLTSGRLTTASGERVALSLPASPTLQTSVDIALPKLEADSYSFTWGANAGDHTMSGTVRFRVQ